MIIRIIISLIVSEADSVRAKFSINTIKQNIHKLYDMLQRHDTRSILTIKDLSRH